jgi:hypothetical protein
MFYRKWNKLILSWRSINMQAILLSFSVYHKKNEINIPFIRSCPIGRELLHINTPFIRSWRSINMQAILLSFSVYPKKNEINIPFIRSCPIGRELLHINTPFIRSCPTAASVRLHQINSIDQYIDFSWRKKVERCFLLSKKSKHYEFAKV